ncbi:MAG: hypothetical protein F6J90_05470 [Moorea sp. SIOASIH]|uniref:hypothetical protein n=1 Tax=Moorena sp. SIOASIH TaxID=2607817 RepID=UPI0013BE81E9|nr:hypothetical protein [Moorena sp. SIOASIH]NEO35801.1 hypothetical protein [Moorena sp. SIOASIH]
MGETTAVAHGGNPQDRTASPRPRCLPKTALPPQDRAAFPRPRCIAPKLAEKVEVGSVDNTSAIQVHQKL